MVRSSLLLSVVCGEEARLATSLAATRIVRMIGTRVSSFTCASLFYSMQHFPCLGARVFGFFCVGEASNRTEKNVKRKQSNKSERQKRQAIVY